MTEARRRLSILALCYLNDTYRAIAAALAASAARPAFKSRALPSEAELAQLVTRQFTFRRYDDGWRVEAHRLLSCGGPAPRHCLPRPTLTLSPEIRRGQPG
jgi:hypothetical protein